MFEKSVSDWILVIDDDGNKLGQMHLSEARERAKEKNLDLVKISDKHPIVYKIMDEGKWKYHQKKKQKLKTKGTVCHLKEMKFRVGIDSHDQETKIKHIKKFLEKGSIVKIVVEMKKRERMRPELATEKIKSILLSLDGICKIDGTKRTSSNISVMLRPVSVKH